VSSCGVSDPVLALKSPHMMVVSCGCVWSIMSSICAVAWSSVMSLLFRDDVGGKYTFTMLILWLFGSIILACIPYSFPFVYSIVYCFLIYIAIPPRLPFLLRSSIMLYPCIVGGIAPGAIHVSCTHSTSTSSYAKSMYNFRYVRPRIFILPTFSPCVSHVLRLECALLFLLREPFVLFIAYIFLSLGCCYISWFI
jgi:hypothetical protein